MTSLILMFEPYYTSTKLYQLTLFLEMGNMLGKIIIAS
jgi:hypothetical protein